MVESWIKRRLIRDFFELLAEDGAADLRRLNYWLKWEPYIDDMWFILGTDARANRTAAFLELRKRMAGRDRSLVDPNSQNNAFVMRMGPLVVVEFGVTGNAARIFTATEFLPDLDQKWFDLSELKQKNGATRLFHRGQWESRFDSELKVHLKGLRAPRVAPITTPSRVNVSAAQPQLPTIAPRHLSDEEVRSFMTLCTWNALQWENNLDDGGAFWILIPDRSKKSAIAEKLELRGFQYSPGRGFWIKGAA
jgi:hypothetical protein